MIKHTNRLNKAESILWDEAWAIFIKTGVWKMPKKIMNDLPNAKLTITWYEKKIATLWLDERLIYETRIIISEINLLKTEIDLPILEAIKLATFILKGLTRDGLEELYAMIRSEVRVLKKLRIPLMETCDDHCENCEVYPPDVYSPTDESEDDESEDDEEWEDPRDFSI